MEVKLAAGAEVDLATKDDLRKSTDDLGDLFRKVVRKDSTVRPLSGSIGTGAANNLSTTALTYVDLGTPSAGKTWDVTLVTILKQDSALTAVTTPWAVYVAPSGSAPNPTDSVAFGTALPGQASFGKGNCVLRNGEHLVVGIVAKTATDIYAVGARVNEINSADLPEGLKH